MSFATEINCDACGELIHVSGIATKKKMLAKARSAGWSMGKYHLCEICRKNRAKLKAEGWIR